MEATFNCDVISLLVAGIGRIEIYCEDGQWFARAISDCERLYAINILCPVCECGFDGLTAYGYANFDVEYCCSVSEAGTLTYMVNVELFITAPC